MHCERLRQFVDRHLPLIIFLTPVITVNLAYIIASVLDYVPDCVTYLSGCTSISSTGRVMPQKGVFLAGLLPTAIWSVYFWQTAQHKLGGVGNTDILTQRWTLIAGTTASVFLMVYTSTLGVPGEVYSLIRKFAVLIYFGFTFIAQLLVVRGLTNVSQRVQDKELEKYAIRLKRFCVLMMTIGILIVPFSLLEDPVLRKKIENIIEWNFAFLLYLFFLLVYPLWKKRSGTTKE